MFLDLLVEIISYYNYIVKKIHRRTDFVSGQKQRIDRLILREDINNKILHSRINDKIII